MAWVRLLVAVAGASGDEPATRHGDVVASSAVPGGPPRCRRLPVTREARVMADVTALSVGAIAAGSVLLSQWIQGRASRAKDDADRRQRLWEERRDAYLRLLVEIGRIESAAAGALATGRSRAGTSEELRPFHEALNAAEFYSTPRVWAQMQPLTRAVALRANATSGAADASMRQAIRDDLRALGAEAPEGWERLWEAYLAAARADLEARR